MCLPHAKQAQKLEQQILTTEKHPYMKQHPTLLKKKKKRKNPFFFSVSGSSLLTGAAERSLKWEPTCAVQHDPQVSFPSGK